MSYGTHLTLDQPIWFRNDFSSESKLTGTLYTDVNRTVKKNLTGFTLTLKLWKPRTVGDRFNKVASIVSAVDGTWEYAVQEGDMPIYGLYYVGLELTKAGVRETNINQVEFMLLEGPNA